MSQLLNVTVLLFVVGVLVGFTNIITQVIKKVTWDKIPTQLLAFIVSQILSIISLLVYCAVCSIVIVWYYIVAAVIVGFMVSYAAMFGFDKLVEIVKGWGTLKSKSNE